MKRFRIVDCPSIYKNRGSIYVNIKQGNRVVAERILFTEAEKIVKAVNQSLLITTSLPSGFQNRPL